MNLNKNAGGCNELHSIISGELPTQRAQNQKAYGGHEGTIGDDGHVGAAVTVYGLGDGLRVRVLVYGDCLDATGDCGGRAGGGGVGTRLDWTAGVDGGALGSVRIRC